MPRELENHRDDLLAFGGVLESKLAGIAQSSEKFQRVVGAVVDAMKHLPRTCSNVEALNSQLRSYFTLRCQLGTPSLDLLQFFQNHRTNLRSRCPERVGKRPQAPPITSKNHPHWLEQLGFTRFQRT